MTYYVLLLLYAFLLLFHAWHYQQPTIPRWPLLIPETQHLTTTTCLQTSDCDAHHVCLNQVCVPKLLRGETCYPETGAWILSTHLGRTFAICNCNDHDLVTQKYFGGNCDEYVACQPHGLYDIYFRTCDCPPGYVSYDYKCKRMTAVEAINHYDCEKDEVLLSETREEYGFTTPYLQANHEKKCFKEAVYVRRFYRPTFEKSSLRRRRGMRVRSDLGSIRRAVGWNG